MNGMAFTSPGNRMAYCWVRSALGYSAVAYPDFVADLVSVLFAGALGHVRIAACREDRAEADAAPVGVVAQRGDQAADRFCGIQSAVMAGC
jgi:hypothetical protein